MDGVIVNFTNSYLELVNSKLTFEDIVECDIWKITNQTEREFYTIMSNAGEDWWANMKPHDEYKELFETLKTIDGSGVTFLTSVYDHSAALGKIKWLNKWFPQEPIIPVCFDTEKWKYANADSILIDDKPSNVIEFIKHGGKGFLYKRLWNENFPDLPVFDINAISKN